MQELGQGKKALVFTVTVNQATLTADAMKAAGIKAEVISGETPRTQRAGLLASLRAGRLDALVNCAVLVEGYDDPSVDCIVIARPTKSKPLYVQQVGRGLRLHPGKDECLVIDLVGASIEHNLISSAALLTHERETPESDGEDGGEGGNEEGEIRTKWSAWFADRKRSEFAWADVPEVSPQAWAINTGEEGTVALVEQDGGFIALVLRTRGRVDYPAGRWPLDHTTAQGCAEDFVRQAEAAALAGRREPWRSGTSTPKQQALLRRMGFTDIPRSKGECEKLITGKITQRRLVQMGLVERVREDGQMEMGVG